MYFPRSLPTLDDLSHAIAHVNLARDTGHQRFIQIKEGKCEVTERKTGESLNQQELVKIIDAVVKQIDRNVSSGDKVMQLRQLKVLQEGLNEIKPEHGIISGMFRTLFGNDEDDFSKVVTSIEIYNRMREIELELDVYLEDDLDQLNNLVKNLNSEVHYSRIMQKLRPTYLQLAPHGEWSLEWLTSFINRGLLPPKKVLFEYFSEFNRIEEDPRVPFWNMFKGFITLSAGHADIVKIFLNGLKAEQLPIDMFKVNGQGNQPLLQIFQEVTYNLFQERNPEIFAGLSELEISTLRENVYSKIKNIINHSRGETISVEDVLNRITTRE